MREEAWRWFPRQAFGAVRAECSHVFLGSECYRGFSAGAARRRFRVGVVLTACVQFVFESSFLTVLRFSGPVLLVIVLVRDLDS